MSTIGADFIEAWPGAWSSPEILCALVESGARQLSCGAVARAAARLLGGPLSRLEVFHSLLELGAFRSAESFASEFLGEDELAEVARALIAAEERFAAGLESLARRSQRLALDIDLDADASLELWSESPFSAEELLAEELSKLARKEDEAAERLRQRLGTFEIQNASPSELQSWRAEVARLLDARELVMAERLLEEGPRVGRACRPGPLRLPVWPYPHALAEVFRWYGPEGESAAPVGFESERPAAADQVAWSLIHALRDLAFAESVTADIGGAVIEALAAFMGCELRGPVTEHDEGFLALFTRFEAPGFPAFADHALPGGLPVWVPRSPIHPLPEKGAALTLIVTAETRQRRDPGGLRLDARRLLPLCGLASGADRRLLTLRSLARDLPLDRVIPQRQRSIAPLILGFVEARALAWTWLDNAGFKRVDNEALDRLAFRCGGSQGLLEELLAYILRSHREASAWRFEVDVVSVDEAWEAPDFRQDRALPAILNGIAERDHRRTLAAFLLARQEKKTLFDSVPSDEVAIAWQILFESEPDPEALEGGLEALSRLGILSGSASERSLPRSGLSFLISELFAKPADLVGELGAAGSSPDRALVEAAVDAARGGGLINLVLAPGSGPHAAALREIECQLAELEGTTLRRAASSEELRWYLERGTEDGVLLVEDWELASRGVASADHAEMQRALEAIARDRRGSVIAFSSAPIPEIQRSEPSSFLTERILARMFILWPGRTDRWKLPPRSAAALPAPALDHLRSEAGLEAIAATIDRWRGRQISDQAPEVQKLAAAGLLLRVDGRLALHPAIALPLQEAEPVGTEGAAEVLELILWERFLEELACDELPELREELAELGLERVEPIQGLARFVLSTGRPVVETLATLFRPSELRRLVPGAKPGAAKRTMLERAFRVWRGGGRRGP